MANTATNLEQVVSGRSCANCDGNSESRQKLDQADLDLILESINRIKLVSKMLWEFDEIDKIERGTISLLLDRECQHMDETRESLECRLGV